MKGMLFLVGVLVVAGCGRGGETSGPTAPAAPAPAEVEIAQKVCPVMGGAIDKDIYVDHQGRRVYFCCSACIDVFKQDPGKYLKKLDEAQQEAPAAEQEQGSHGEHEGQ